MSRFPLRSAGELVDLLLLHVHLGDYFVSVGDLPLYVVADNVRRGTA